MKAVPLETITSMELTVDGFCKKLDGSFGKGAFSFQIKGSKLYSKESEISFEKLRLRLNGHYLLQERVKQHPKMSELHPGSVNTIRMITSNNGGTIEVFSAALRIGTQGRSVDNWSAGGILVEIDLQTGCLQKEGFFKPGYGGKITQHPDTGTILESFAIPFLRISSSLLVICTAICMAYIQLAGILPSLLMGQLLLKEIRGGMVLLRWPSKEILEAVSKMFA